MSAAALRPLRHGVGAQGACVTRAYFASSDKCDPPKDNKPTPACGKAPSCTKPPSATCTKPPPSKDGGCGGGGSGGGGGGGGAGQGVIVAPAEAKRFFVDAFVKAGATQQHATQFADVLLYADYKGHISHGLNRLEMYITDLETKLTDGKVEPKVLKESESTAWVDGLNGLGAVVGNFCMQLAIKKAQKSGVGWVVARRSNHFGIASWYSDQALQSGLVGMCMTNTSPLVAPSGAKKATLGTNPITLSAPAKFGDSFVMDMATTSVAVGKIEVAMKKGEPLPEGVALGPDGKPTTDAKLAMDALCLMPLGGTLFGHKGYALAMSIEILCGIMADSQYGPFIRSWGSTDAEANLGHCFAAINPNCFAPCFLERMSSIVGFVRHMEPADPAKPVMAPGDFEKANMRRNDKQGGISYHKNAIAAAEALAKKLGIEPMKPKGKDKKHKDGGPAPTSKCKK